MSSVQESRSLLIVGTLVAATSLAFVAHYINRRRRSRPPGPLGYPLIGNALHLTESRDPRAVAALGKKYGSLIYMEMFGTPIALFNTEAALDLLDKRGAIYSDRPTAPMASEYSGMGDLTPLLRYGPKFQFARRLMKVALSPQAVKKWEAGIADESLAMLRNMFSAPKDFVAHFNQVAGCIVMLSMYGHRVASADDPYVSLAIEFMVASTDAIGGRYLVDFFPIVKHIPFGNWREVAAGWKARIPEWVDRAFDAFKDNMHTSEDAKNSLCGHLMITADGSPVPEATETRVKWIATSGFGAGLDTMVAALSHFIMAMVLHPEAQARAQKEIDSVVGRDRLPTFEDRENLPFMECVYKESLRWGVPVPLSAPHRLMQDDVYGDYVLPEGTICVGNVWGILHDETLYKNPEDFAPERFLGLDEEEAKKLDPSNYVYGFGRRRCPGSHFAHSAVWISMVGLLAAFVISPEIDENGNEIPIKAEYDSGSIRHVVPFPIRATLRHDKVSELLSVA